MAALEVYYPAFAMIIVLLQREIRVHTLCSWDVEAVIDACTASLPLLVLRFTLEGQELLILHG
jgi:hypothetical protein